MADMKPPTQTITTSRRKRNAYAITHTCIHTHKAKAGCNSILIRHIDTLFRKNAANIPVRSSSMACFPNILHTHPHSTYCPRLSPTWGNLCILPLQKPRGPIQREACRNRPLFAYALMTLRKAGSRAGCFYTSEKCKETRWNSHAPQVGHDTCIQGAILKLSAVRDMPRASVFPTHGLLSWQTMTACLLHKHHNCGSYHQLIPISSSWRVSIYTCIFPRIMCIYIYIEIFH